MVEGVDEGVDEGVIEGMIEKGAAGGLLARIEECINYDG